MLNEFLSDKKEELRKIFEKDLSGLFIINMIMNSKKEIIDKSLEITFQQFNESMYGTLNRLESGDVLIFMSSNIKNIFEGEFKSFIEECGMEAMKEFKERIYEMYSKI